MTEILAIRHAQASFDADDYDQLSAHGETQALRLGRWLAADHDYAFDAVVVGAMRRHQQTLAGIEQAYAEIGRPLPEAEIDAGFNEFDHGAVLAAFLAGHPEHRSASVGAMPGPKDRMAVARYLLAALRHWASGAMDAQLDEGWFAFRARIAAAMTRLTERHRGRERVLLVTSGGVIAQLAQRALEVPDARSVDLNIAIRNSALSEFVLFDGGMRLLSFNQLPHLAAPGERQLWTHF
jgi:broad specificity phosphatase PhoE